MSLIFPHHPTSNAELLAHLIGSNQVSRAETILQDFQGLQGLALCSGADLARHPELTQQMSLRIQAAFELGHRSLQPNSPTISITTPEQVFQLVWHEMMQTQDEMLIVQFLNRRKKLIQQKILTQGSDGMTIVDPKQIFHHALRCRSHGIIMAHNHPSGDPSPSQQDLQITKRVQEIGSVLNIPLLDHIIVGGDSFVSLRALGAIS